jgi:CHAT domain-containing protein
VRPVRPAQDRQVAELLAELRQIVDRAHAGDDGPDTSAHRRRITEIQRSLRSRSWQAQGTGGASETVRRDALTAGLAGADSVLVSYATAQGALYAAVVGRGLSRVVTIGALQPLAENANRVRADLDAIASGYLAGALGAAVYASLARSITELDRTLIEPLGLPDAGLVIVPTGVLGTLPWTNLPSLRGRPVVVAPSATSWLESTAGPTRQEPLSVVALAGPGLARSDEEVKQIGELWPHSTVFAADGARRSEVAAAMTTATIVHVAAHGEHHAENPLFSSLQLADGPLFAYELDQTARAAEHVILSACELGQATIRPGDEALGLTSVLLHLGTRSVIAGVARVHDDVAAEVMTRYHALLSSGVDSARALAEACAEQRDLPAPFVCFGSAWSAG